MSIFSKIRGAKKAADEHKKPQSDAAEKPKAAPYKHIPTHAAIDALSGAPSSWKENDRSKIQAHHKRRSMMSRNQSELSTSTMANNYRHSSYTGNTWGERGGDMKGVNPHQGTSYRAQEGYRHHEIGMARSPLASNEITPAGSSGNSTSSNSSSRKRYSVSFATEPITYGTAEILEIRPPVQRQESSILDTLHTSTTRKLGEAPLHDAPPPRPQATVVTPPSPAVAQRKRKFGFGRKSTAIAV
ncbi:MAG: hypothetical protein M1827_006678 [Pycnora praestabilis]|nr:MAG: hypothetical protein M1827_006678 [Pycnora praestabilis]